MTDGTLHTKYRPAAFKQVVGQMAAIKSLSSVLNRDGSHAFLFTGPSGCGKTTLARIAAHFVRCDPKDILEIAAALKTGVDDMRDIQEFSLYRPLGGGESRAIILDECHRLSKNAWDALLKAIEEPPRHMYWFLCTTDPGKVPATIKTRCTTINLKLVADADMRGLIDDVCIEEGIKLSDDVIALVLKNARGSPRQALVSLSQVRDAKDKREAAQILQTALETEPTVELCRMLVAGTGSWQKAMSLVAKLDEDPESVRIIVNNYVAAVLIEASTDKSVMHLCRILDSFSKSYNQSDRLAPLLLSIGNVLIAN